MKKKQIYILFNDSSTMMGEGIESANVALDILLSAWCSDPYWQENLEVEVWLASGQLHVRYPNLLKMGHIDKISCSVEQLPEGQMGETLLGLLTIPPPNRTSYYQPQLVIISDHYYKWNAAESLVQAFNNSSIDDCLLLGTGYGERLSLPFPHHVLSVDNLNPHFACDCINLEELKVMRERSDALAKRLLQAAAQGDVDAQYQLGHLYRRGLGVTKSTTEAQKWYLSAADQGHDEALLHLGDLHWLGLIDRADKAEAVKWYHQAAEKGNADAQHRLGVMNKFRQLEYANDEMALKWWQHAADQGHIESQFELGKMYQQGLGVVKNVERASYWYRQAADQGNEIAKCYLQQMSITEARNADAINLDAH